MTSLSGKEEIKRRLKEIEKERNTLQQELAALPSDLESNKFYKYRAINEHTYEILTKQQLFAPIRSKRY